MKLIILFLISSIWFPSTAKALSTSQSWVDGRMVFTGTPDPWEINLSTCIPFSIEAGGGIKLVFGFESKSDWLACQTRIGLKIKFLKIRPIIDALTADFPANDPLLVDLKQRFGWLKSYYTSLP